MGHFVKQFSTPPLGPPKAGVLKYVLLVPQMFGIAVIKKLKCSIVNE
jgi:hypothetical protein